MPLPLPILLLSCLGPLPDPLAEQRAALRDLPPLEQGWAPQATLELGRDTLETLIARAMNGMLDRGIVPYTTTVLGVPASIEADARVVRARLEASAGCEDCLSLDVELAGSILAQVGSGPGARQTRFPFQSALSGVMALRLEDEQILASPAAPERWKLSLEWKDLPTGMNQLVSGVFTDALRRQLLLDALPALPVARLRGETPVPVTGMRLRSDVRAVVLDLAFAIPTSGVSDRAPDTASGWCLVLPQATALGLAQAVALGQAYDPNARVTPELVDLRVDGQTFELGVKAWPTRGRSRPRDLLVQGDFGLTEAGELRLDAREARWLRERGDPPDLGALLLGGRVLDGLIATMSASMPGARQQSLAGVDLVAKTTRFQAVDGDLLVRGSFSLVDGAAP